MWHSAGQSFNCHILDTNIKHPSIARMVTVNKDNIYLSPFSQCANVIPNTTDILLEKMLSTADIWYNVDVQLERSYYFALLAVPQYHIIKYKMHDNNDRKLKLILSWWFGAIVFLCCAIWYDFDVLHYFFRAIPVCRCRGRHHIVCYLRYMYIYIYIYIQCNGKVLKTKCFVDLSSNLLVAKYILATFTMRAREREVDAGCEDKGI